MKRFHSPLRTPVSFLLLLSLAGILMLAGCSLFNKATPMEKSTGIRYMEIITYAGSQADKAFGMLGGSFPVYSRDGQWVETDMGDWAKGYYPGMLWLLSQVSPDPHYKDLARQWLPGLAQLRDQYKSFGLGQVYFPAYVTGYQLTGNSVYRDEAIEAARILMGRLTPAGFFPAFGAAGDTVLGRRLSIESIMDLELLYWAKEATGTAEYEIAANNHAFFTLSRLVGADGRVLNMADFNPRTGNTWGERTPELNDPRYAPRGISASSCWALGQAWAIYGFTSVYRHQGKTMFLDTAQRTANYFLSKCAEDGLPPWDLDATGSDADLKDASAAAVAAAGMLKLARLSPNQNDRVRYQKAGEKIISTLSSRYFRHGAGVLGGGVFRSADRGDAVSTVWGDYYYIEALLLLMDYDV